MRIAAEAGLARAFKVAALSPTSDLQALYDAQATSRSTQSRVSDAVISFLTATIVSRNKGSHIRDAKLIYTVIENDCHGRNSLALMSGILWSHHQLRDVLLHTTDWQTMAQQDPALEAIFDLYAPVLISFICQNVNLEYEYRSRQAERNVATAYSLPSSVQASASLAHQAVAFRDTLLMDLGDGCVSQGSWGPAQGSSEELPGFGSLSDWLQVQ